MEESADEDALALVSGDGGIGLLQLELGEFSGPIDVLLQLARDQKVDLLKISILTLAEQYLAFIAVAREKHLEIAADYLVMAAWLAWLKSRLLLPAQASDDEPSGEELAAALQFQLQRLEAMQKAGQALMQRPVLGRDVLARGMPEEAEVRLSSLWSVSLFDLMRAYGDFHRRQGASSLQIEPLTLYSVEDALRRLQAFLGDMPDWQTLHSYLPPGLEDPLMRRSAVCAHFIAALELVRQGHLDVRQDGGHFTPLHIRARAAAAGDDDGQQQ